MSIGHFSSKFFSKVFLYKSVICNTTYSNPGQLLYFEIFYVAEIHYLNMKLNSDSLKIRE